MGCTALAVALLNFLTVPATANPCPGDCDANAETSAAELVDCVSIALGSADRQRCPACDSTVDGRVSVDELVSAVHQGLTDCRAELVEATTGVTSSAIEGMETFRVLNFGTVGPGGALVAIADRSGGAGQAPCIHCPAGGAVVVDSYRCTVADGGSRLEAVLDQCAEGGVTRSGQIELVVDDPEFCGRCVVRGGVNGRQELTAYTEVFADGRMLVVPSTLREEFALSSQGCREAPLPDRLSTYNGTVRITEGGDTTTFEYLGLLTAVSSVLNDDELCEVFMVQDGRTRIEKTGGTSFVQTADNLILTESPRLDGSREVTIDTPNGGSLTVDCLAGEIELVTKEPIRFREGDACGLAGLLEVSFLAQQATSAIRFTAGGGLMFDIDLDGTFDAGSMRCDADSIAQCQTELPNF